ncbi:hypothetical protein DFJ73DRAFT_789641 [Zopfochytrium polystomum]|nr:hypothetical protein DFJ73DRAFT_789641 [Zopfochytrium polystomum]
MHNDSSQKKSPVHEKLETRCFIGVSADTIASSKPTEVTLRIRRFLLEFIQVLNEYGDIAQVTPYPSQEADAVISSVPPSSVTRIPAGSFLLPTFTDLHIHAAQYLYAGTGLDKPLMEWLDAYAYRAEERVDQDPALAAKVYESLCKRMIAEGTGCALVFGTIAVQSNLILAEAFQKSGLRGFIGKLSMDISSRPTYVEPSAAAALSSAREFVRSLKSAASKLPPHERRVHPVLTPRFVPTCSDELLAGLGEIAKKEDVLVQSHMCESTDQIDWVRATRGCEDEEVFDRHGLLTEKTVQAHVTSLPPKLQDLLHERRTAIAHCPLSNVYFSDAQFPLREALDRPLRVGLGSDIAGGYNISIQTQMRQAVVVSRLREAHRRQQRDEPSAAAPQSLRVEWKESLYLATRGGAEALGLNSGTFEAGAPFDAQLIKLVDEDTGMGIGGIDVFDTLPTALKQGTEHIEDSVELRKWWEEMIERWWCNGDSRNRIGVWVQGSQLL